MPKNRFGGLSRPEIVLAAFVLVYVATGSLLAWRVGQLGQFRPAMYVDTTAFCSLVFMIGYVFYRFLKFYYVVIFVRPPRLRAYLKADFLAGPLNRERYRRALPVFLSFIVLFSTFTSLKSMIPAIQPFRWDVFWADMDQWLHFGVDPWRLLHPVLGHPPVTKFINLIYNLWLPVKYFVLYAMLLSLKNPYTRMQFFFTCALCWVINGTVLAILFSSAGPCFYQHVTGVDRFGELMAYLQGVDPERSIWALKTQAMLWDGHVNGTLAFGSGISAMPSLHVASAFIFMLAGLRSRWIWKVLSVMFYICILLGSVHLGWHYAVDGYLATATTLLLWYFSGKLVRKLEPDWFGAERRGLDANGI